VGSPSTPPVPDAAAASATMVFALPALEKLIEQMCDVLGPPMNVSYEEQQGQGHGHGDGYAEAAWQLTRALGFLCQAAHAANGPGEGLRVHEFLQGVDEAARRAGAHARDVRGVCAPVPALEQMAAPGGQAAIELGDVRVEEMTAKVFAFDEDDNPITDDLTITLLDRDGPTARWEGRRGPLALIGRTFLDLTAAGKQIGEAYDRYLRDTYAQDALGLDQGGPR
jgi:hypothetical protein